MSAPRTPDERMDYIIDMARGVNVAADNFDLSRLDREQMPAWIDMLREVEAGARRLRGAFAAVLADAERRCPVCDRAVTGRADQVYCGAACRQGARRSRVR